MSETDKSSKTEEPTSKRLEEAASRGQFAKAPEIGTVFVLAAAFLVLLFTAKGHAAEIGRAAQYLFGHLHAISVTREAMAEWAPLAIYFVLGLLVPMALAASVAAIISGGLQTGFKLSPKALEMKADKLNPVNGFKKIFSLKSAFQAVVDLLKFVAVAGIIAGVVYEAWRDPIFQTPVSLDHLGQFIFETSLAMFLRLIVALGLIAVVNYIFQKRKNLEELRMTKQEVKDENKQTQGDPKVKQAQRRMAMQNIQKQMLSAVPTADVVVTNPTHYAVALKYERGRDEAPLVLAKGQNRFALKIKAVAREHGVPMVENKPVARMLYKFGEPGRSIPLELYQVVAEILAHVYRSHRYYFHRLKSRREAGQNAAQTAGATD